MSADLEFRWDGPAAVEALGDDPTRAQINALFAIPGSTKTDSSLPHHDVSGGKVGAADKDGCIAAIGALNGGRGGVSASTAEKNKAYSHLASHLRAMGETPPEKQFAASRSDTELRAQRRSSMLRVPERLSLQFGASGLEMRAKANGSGGTKFQFTGYAAVFDHPFEMWDWWGDQYVEVVNQGAFSRTLANGCDVPFLIGHNDAGIPMARTKSGTMTLGQDTHGLWVDVPDLDGAVEQVRQLASAVERGDMDEMSCAFVCMQQVWSPDYEQRNLIEMDLHKGDVSAVVFGANDGTAGSSIVALPAEQLHLRRPTGIRQRRPGEQRDGGGYPDTNSPDYDPQPHAADPDQLVCPHGSCTADGCSAADEDGSPAAHCKGACAATGGALNGPDAKFCDQCGGSMYSEDGKITISADGVPEESSGDSAMLAAQRAGLERRQRELQLLALAG
jgi:HK97 family phage prohead protease